MRCPVHNTWMRFDERTTDSCPDGLAPLGVERTFVVVRVACPVDECGYTHEEITDRD